MKRIVGIVYDIWVDYMARESDITRDWNKDRWSMKTGFNWKKTVEKIIIDTVMQIEKALINDCLRVSKVSWKFRIHYIVCMTIPLIIER